ncbi:MAG: hypothetical protein A3J74_07165 [Elusimicrobia bacterium RIFCSPHIGHO2_02_FULL_57_9]|nr:MAG: hypothetical protein A3J74_07165 [Elusimicrobia bacterium RIFCSPHIGHO2_02_FULL_57_9]
MTKFSRRFVIVLPLFFSSLAQSARLSSHKAIDNRVNPRLALPVSAPLRHQGRPAPGAQAGSQIEALGQLRQIAPLGASAADEIEFIEQSEQIFQGGLPRDNPASEPAVSAEPGFPSDEQIMSDLNIGGITNAEREKKVIAHFQKLGATGAPIHVEEGEAPPLNVYNTVIIQNAGAPGKNNIYVVKKGKTDRKVIDGGHMDRVGGGSHGIIDNYSGSLAVRYDYEALRAVETDATIVFINFAREEEGLVGSRAWLNAFPASQLSKFDAMQNLDTEGLAGLYILENGTTPKLRDMAMEIARKLGIEASLQEIRGGDSDHTLFRRVGIPALMLFQGTEEDIFGKIHSENDNISNFLLDHYKNVLRLSRANLKELASKPQREAITFVSGAADYAKVPELAAKEDFTGLRKVRAQIDRAAYKTADPMLRQQLIRAKLQIAEMLDADVRFKGYNELIAARALARSGRHAEAARKYEQAAKFYRAVAARGHGEADYFLRLAVEERSLTDLTTPRLIIN